jgi:hypothetical protein
VAGRLLRGFKVTSKEAERRIKSVTLDMTLRHINPSRTLPNSFPIRLLSFPISSPSRSISNPSPFFPNVSPFLRNFLQPNQRPTGVAPSLRARANAPASSRRRLPARRRWAQERVTVFAARDAGWRRRRLGATGPLMLRPPPARAAPST